MKRKTYSMSFTTGSLLHRESVIVAQLLEELTDWNSVREKAIADNRLQMRTPNSSSRIYREVVSRLKQFTLAETELFNEGSHQEQIYLLWLAVCKRYKFIYDFAVEIIREKYLRLDLELTYDEYNAFFNNKAEWHPEVEAVAETTRSKQRQVIFRMLREAELLTPGNRIIPAIFTPRFVDIVTADSPMHFAIFPASDLDIPKVAP